MAYYSSNFIRLANWCSNRNCATYTYRGGCCFHYHFFSGCTGPLILINLYRLPSGLLKWLFCGYFFFSGLDLQLQDKMHKKLWANILVTSFNDTQGKLWLIKNEKQEKLNLVNNWSQNSIHKRFAIIGENIIWRNGIHFIGDKLCLRHFMQ